MNFLAIHLELSDNITCVRKHKAHTSNVWMNREFMCFAILKKENIDREPYKYFEMMWIKTQVTWVDVDGFLISFSQNHNKCLFALWHEWKLFYKRAFGGSETIVECVQHTHRNTIKCRSKKECVIALFKTSIWSIIVWAETPLTGSCAETHCCDMLFLGNLCTYVNFECLMYYFFVFYLDDCKWTAHIRLYAPFKQHTHTHTFSLQYVLFASVDNDLPHKMRAHHAQTCQQ